MAKIRGIKCYRLQTFEGRLVDLQRRGVLVRSGTTRNSLQPVACRPGALVRFLPERSE